MKRAFPQKVKPVSCDASVYESTQTRPASAGTHRRARTSAAMIGLALSMGASSLLLPRQDDSAAAAEPRFAESTSATAPLSFHVAALPPGTEAGASLLPSASAPRAMSHIVREGETLWQISRKYGVPIRALASTNGLVADSVLRVGQTIRLPATAPASTTAVAPRPTAATVVTATAATQAPSSPVSQLRSVDIPTEIDSGLREQTESSLNRLREQRDKLKESLEELEAGDPKVSSTQEPPKVEGPAAPELVSPEAQPTFQAPAWSESGSDKPGEELAETVMGSMPEGATYQVKPGDTLGAIAQEHDVPQQMIAYANNLPDPNVLQVDESLIIPSEPFLAEPSQPAAEPQLLAYEVSPGQTLSEIARLHNIPVEAILGANDLRNPDFILVGQVLRIPTQSIQPVLPEDSEDSPVLVDSTRPPATRSLLESTLTTIMPTLAQVPSQVLVPTAPVEQGAAALTVREVMPEQPETGVLFSDEYVGNVPPVSQEVAAAPLSIPTEVRPEASTPSRPSVRENPFVENLLQDINDLRDRYRETEAAADVAAPEVPVVQREDEVVVAAASIESAEVLLGLPEPARINPEFNPTAYEESASVESPGFANHLRVVLPEAASEPEVLAPVADEVQPQIVAVAPLGSENYEPLLQPITGQMVSPELPPLPDSAAYLPDGSAVFDGYIWPAQGILTSGYGWRWGRMHRGIDIGAPTGTPVHAAAAGVVEFSGWNSGGYGNMVEVRHPDGSMTRYAHHSRNLVRVGDRVAQGQQIAEVGSTGYSTGPHLHFEIHLPSQGTVNPIAYLPR